MNEREVCGLGGLEVESREVNIDIFEDAFESNRICFGVNLVFDFLTFGA